MREREKKPKSELEPELERGEIVKKLNNARNELSEHIARATAKAELLEVYKRIDDWQKYWNKVYDKYQNDSNLIHKTGFHKYFKEKNGELITKYSKKLETFDSDKNTQEPPPQTNEKPQITIHHKITQEPPPKTKEEPKITFLNTSANASAGSSRPETTIPGQTAINESFNPTLKKYESTRHKIAFEGRTIDFFHQNNIYDCVVCSCLNTVQALGLPSDSVPAAQSVDDFRKLASTAAKIKKIEKPITFSDGKHKHNSDLIYTPPNNLITGEGRTKCLRMDDAEKFFRNNFSVDLVHIANNNLQTVLTKYAGDKMILGIPNYDPGNPNLIGHCTAYFIDTNENCYLFDSFATQPQRVKMKDVRDFVDTWTKNYYRCYSDKSSNSYLEQPTDPNHEPYSQLIMIHPKQPSPRTTIHNQQS